MIKYDYPGIQKTTISHSYGDQKGCSSIPSNYVRIHGLIPAKLDIKKVKKILNGFQVIKVYINLDGMLDKQIMRRGAK